MREFHYDKMYSVLLTADTSSMITQIHEYREQLQQMPEVEPDTLRMLTEIAKIQSTEASNRIEGIRTSDDRLNQIVQDKTTPRNRDEQQIKGYRDVLNTIHESYRYIEIRPSFILQLHRDLYRHVGSELGGNFKNADNVIVEFDANGKRHVRFQPMAAWETPEALENLCASFQLALDSEECDSLLLIPVFVLDFLCIHPFNDGNGRMSRLLTLLLLYHAGYDIGKYISLEKKIEQTKDTYYETLQQSSSDWYEEKNDCLPFVKYLLSTLLAAYRELDERIKILHEGGTTKAK